MKITCLSCGKSLTPETKYCPNCGSQNRHKVIKANASFQFRDMVLLKQKSAGYRKFKKRVKKGEKISKHGKPAREELIIDKEKRRKYHKVEEQDENGEWQVVEYHDGSLDEKD